MEARTASAVFFSLDVLVPMNKIRLAFFIVAFFVGLTGVVGVYVVNSQPTHKNVTTTVFWVGEPETKENAYISNVPSAWDDEWMQHFGGEDSPQRRNGFYPAEFSPKENPFYVALPYNDFDESGKRKLLSSMFVPWADEKRWDKQESMLKNRWLKISKNGRVAYAQWEDVGPFEDDNPLYVFWNFPPKNKENNGAGLDVSPAVRDYLQLEDIDKTDWEFVDARDVPDGPWKEIVTTSQVSWKK